MTKLEAGRCTGTRARSAPLERPFGPAVPAARLGVVFLVVTIAGTLLPRAAAAQIASVAVTAQVTAPDEPVIPAALDLAASPTFADGAARPTGWTERPHPSRPFVTRYRLRNEPRTGSAGAGLMLDVVLDYVGN
jgi:hypothetical protein